MIVIAIMTIIMTMAIPLYRRVVDEAEVTVAISEIREIEKQIDLYILNHGELPDSLSDLADFGNLVDPWGNPYQYYKFPDADAKGGNGNGKKRKNRFLVPINSTFDLYSMGADGKSVGPLTSKNSRDDIVRANDGEFLGLASDY